MTLAHGTDRLETTRLVLRRIAVDDCRSSLASTHFPKSRNIFIPEAGPRSPEKFGRLVARHLKGYDQLGLGCLAVQRKEDGALIGRCGLTDLVIEAAAPCMGLAEDGSGAH